jgi:hypothetical protein
MRREREEDKGSQEDETEHETANGETQRQTLNGKDRDIHIKTAISSGTGPADNDEILRDSDGDRVHGANGASEVDVEVGTPQKSVVDRREN